MSEAFVNALEKTVENGNAFTENGAVGYKTCGKSLVDFFFKASSYRNADESVIFHDFAEAYNDDHVLAVKMLFLLGDIRKGLGERRLFSTCMHWLCRNDKSVALKLIQLIPEYSRWDVLIGLIEECNVQNEVLSIIMNQLDIDNEAMKLDLPVSLLAKWMPSVNTSSKHTCFLGRFICNLMKMKESSYRKMLSKLRKYIDVVECRMSSNDWSGIDYNAVPSKANVIYRNAFMLHDKERRSTYLYNLANGKDGASINAGAVFPYDIVNRYMQYDECHGFRYRRKIGDTEEDATLEQMWKSLPDYVNGKGYDVLCMVDGSGSMCSTLNNTDVSCHDVARSLAIYFSERMDGAFKDKFITFSANPELVNLSGKQSLIDKLKECSKHSECENTDIEKAFDLVLKTAVSNGISKDDMPKSILVLSDMEFDSGVDCESEHLHGEYMTCMKTLFDSMKCKYESHGYVMPRLVFWNICSRTNVIPLKCNELGIVLVSGFSPTIADMVFSNDIDPYEAVVKKMNGARYDAVEKAIVQ